MSEPKPSLWACALCEYVYDETHEGIPWDQLPDDWECPLCGATRAVFQPVAPAAD